MAVALFLLTETCGTGADLLAGPMTFPALLSKVKPVSSALKICPGLSMSPFVVRKSLKSKNHWSMSFLVRYDLENSNGVSFRMPTISAFLAIRIAACYP